jgi:SAM-dependent methyltransferase
MPSKSDLDGLYSKSWLEPETNTSETGGTDERLAGVYADKLRTALGVPDFSTRAVLDFGAGRGSMVKALRDLGAETYAVEPFGYHQLRAQGFSVFRSLLDLPADLRFDGIVTLDVLEHVPLPWETIGQLHALLKPRGWIFVATPNNRSLAARMRGADWSDASNPGHLVVLSPRSLLLALETGGFRRVRRQTWFIRYADSIERRLIHWCLQAARIDGELRYVAWK